MSEWSGYRIIDLLLNVGAERIPDNRFIVKCQSGAETGPTISEKLSERSRFRITNFQRISEQDGDRIMFSIEIVGSERIPVGRFFF